jgi:hypothetical protein
MQLKVIGKIEAQLKFVNFKLKTLNARLDLKINKCSIENFQSQIPNSSLMLTNLPSTL